MISKIKAHHKEKMAYVYLRQSTMGQVLHHQESTERQYALKERAESCGWMPEHIRILDGDLGISGARMSNRQDFKTLVADVSLNKVGAIFALEASRLSRSSNDWNRLFELCSLTDTLIIDEDGRIVLDPDEEVRSAVAMIFETFKEAGNAYAVSRYFGMHNLRFPKRAYGGVWKGKLIWGRLTYERVLGVLKKSVLRRRVCVWSLPNQEAHIDRR